MELEKINIYGTLGPACQNQEILEEMFTCGMNGMRLNLSHTGLAQCSGWLESFRQAAAAAKVQPELLIDLQGPELRVENTDIYDMPTGALVTLGAGGVPVPEIIFTRLTEGQQILLDDGRLLLEVVELIAESSGTRIRESGEVMEMKAAAEAGTRVAAARCRVLRGGLLKPRKSIALPGVEIPSPTLTKSDLHNLSMAKEYGVTGVMLPFVRNEQDLICLRAALEQAGASDIKIYAKIENMAGVNMLKKLLPYADEIVIARGDLGNAMPLWELPVVQYEIGNICRRAGKPYMVVTQMLASMEHAAVPTRAEVSDIFYAVLHGASSVMLTGETAAGEYPVEAMRYMCETVKRAMSLKGEQRKIRNSDYVQSGESCRT